jgi:glutamate-ammonia-ligase adenylyltransferase
MLQRYTLPWRYTLDAVSGSRTFSLTGWLARMGFPDAARAERMLAALGITGEEPLLSALAGAADPELALTGLAGIAERIGPEGTLHASLNADADFRERMVAVLGVSKVFADHLARHPADCYVLFGPGAALRPSAAQIRAELLVAAGAEGGGPGSVAALTAAYRRRVLHLAARDLTGAATVDEVTGELADIAAAACEAALAIARAELPGGAADAGLAVVAMGKCGARELNYASDVDVIFVADDGSDMRTATQLAAGMIRACELVTPEGYLFPVDPNLRPEGRDGALVRTLPSHLAYYDRWAKTWEFQALLKARPVAGDLDLGERYKAAVGPLVWEAAQREHFVEDVQAMRRRVIDNIPKNLAGRELKLGPGGLRDIEFAVQLLQLVHGRTDESLRVPATLPALAALAAGGYVGREDADALAESYRFLRRTEHLLQLHQLRRTHTLPEDPAVLRRLGRAMRLTDIHHGPMLPPEEAFTAALRKHAIRVRRLHEKLFYRPLLDAVARLPSDAARLSPAAARARLEALGYADPAGALRHIEALTTGVRRRAAIQRTLLPVLLEWFADAAEPDAGLLAFRQVSEALGETPWYLRLLRDETKAAHRMATVLASSRYAAGLLLRAPEAVAIFGDDAELVPKTTGQVRAEMEAAARRHIGASPAGGTGGPSPLRGHPDAESAAVAVRSLRRRELLRVAAADVLGLTGLTETGRALTAITEASLGAVLAAALAKVEMETRGPLPTRFAIIAMGRFGGCESGYGSDADVIFVHDPLPGAVLTGPDGTPDRRASEAAQAVAAELRRLLELPAPDPALLIDAGLRPEGRHGPLVPSLAACKAYYGRRAAPWEFQALLRARLAAGDAALGAEFLAMADPYRYPAGGLPETEVREIRRIKARVEAERIPRGADRALHVKLGPGGLSDVEWTVQLLQLQHAGAIAGLRTTGTLAALTAAVDADLVAAEDARVLSASWQLAARIRNAVTLISGRPGDELPSRYQELTAVARLLGYEGDAPAQSLEDDYRRRARHARSVMERVFYG